MSKNLVVVGATSGIARALCHELSRDGNRLILAGRAREELEKCAADLRVRYRTDAWVELFEALDFSTHAAFFERCLAQFNGELDGFVLCHGYMTDQETTEKDWNEARRTIDVNFTAAVSLLMLAANYFERRKKGYIVALSSVAGDRGRMSNYTYGAAKAGLSVYLQGLRHRLHPAGVQVLTVKPGFVDTPMTAGLLDPQSPLVASPEKIARDINRALRQCKDVLYSPWFWRVIMGLIRGLPERVFKRLRL